jgi:hypothetical protein
LANIAAIVALVPPAFGWGTPTRLPVRFAASDSRPSSSIDQVSERRYRIIGRIRLVLFWVGFDDVGGARMTRRSHDNATTLALLAGSDPQRAPRQVNQWVYLREETRVDRAEAFALRTLGEQAPAQTDVSTGDASLFSASCASINHDRIDSAVTVSTGKLTYRMFGHALDQVAESTRWQARHLSCPVGAAPGFLSALERVMRGAPASPFVYNGALYDLNVRRRQSLGRRQVGARTFDSLMRAELAIGSRENGETETTTFSVTYASGSTEIPLPVQIFYQPSFWVSIELRQDDVADVPPDPAESRSTLTRIQAICNVETE